MKDKLLRIAKKLSVTCGFNNIGMKRNINKENLKRTMSEALSQLNKLNFKPETVIDVGVAYGTYELYNAFSSTKILLIEPLEEYEPTLKTICDCFNADYILTAAGSYTGKITINVHPDLSGSSVLNETEGRHVDGLKREVPIDKIDYLCDKKNLKGPYLIKIDVQGVELEVLEGSKGIIADTEVIILEVSLFQFFSKGPQFYDVVSYMKGLGFCVYDIFGGHFRPFDGALGQVDIIFVKENGPFRTYHVWATREQRLNITEQRMRSLNPK